MSHVNIVNTNRFTERFIKNTSLQKVLLPFVFTESILISNLILPATLFGTGVHKKIIIIDFCFTKHGKGHA